MFLISLKDYMTFTIELWLGRAWGRRFTIALGSTDLVKEREEKQTMDLDLQKMLGGK